MTEKQLRQELRAMDLPPLDVEVIEDPTQPTADPVLRMTQNGRAIEFTCDLRTDAKPMTLDLALGQMARRRAIADDTRPIVLVAPYLSPDKLRLLLDAGFGGVDLCGNAALSVGEWFFFLRDGKANRFRETRPTAGAYRGDTSLVART